jgi:AcrR family transcriptional regulator
MASGHPSYGADAATTAAPDLPEAASPRERRRAQRLESRRREIIAVAEELFATNGYEGTSLQQIADGSGYSVGGIYTFFPSKDAVYAAVTERQGRLLAERLMDCTTTEDTGMSTVLAMASTAIRTMAEFPDRTRLMVRYHPPSHMSASDRGNFRAILEAYAMAIRAGQADGTVRAGDPRHLAQFVGGLVLAQAQVDPEISGDPNGISRADFLDIVRAALAPPST